MNKIFFYNGNGRHCVVTQIDATDVKIMSSTGNLYTIKAKIFLQYIDDGTYRFSLPKKGKDKTTEIELVEMVSQQDCVYFYKDSIAVIAFNKLASQESNNISEKYDTIITIYKPTDIELLLIC